MRPVAKKKTRKNVNLFISMMIILIVAVVIVYGYSLTSERSHLPMLTSASSTSTTIATTTQLTSSTQTNYSRLSGVAVSTESCARNYVCTVPGGYTSYYLEVIAKVVGGKPPYEYNYNLAGLGCTGMSKISESYLNDSAEFFVASQHPCTYIVTVSVTDNTSAAVNNSMTVDWGA